MKRGLIFLALMISLSLVNAGVCELNITMLNQDPYPAVPGDYVKLVFQVEGIQNKDCSDITFELLPNYPLELDPGKSSVKTFRKVDYVKDYETNILVPYEVRINKDALDGATPIEVKVQSRHSAPISKKFNLEIKDVRTDFEVYVKNYDYSTNELTLEILNIKSSDIEALSVEIPKQAGIEVKGANRIVVGDLDSNEYTSADFEAKISDGDFKINLIYSDTINNRRTIEKTVNFDSSYFTNRKADQKTTSSWTYIFLGVIILLVVYWIYSKRKKKKAKKNFKGK